MKILQILSFKMQIGRVAQLDKEILEYTPNKHAPLKAETHQSSKCKTEYFRIKLYS